LANLHPAASHHVVKPPIELGNARDASALVCAYYHPHRVPSTPAAIAAARPPKDTRGIAPMTGTRSSHWSRSLTILCLCATAIAVAWQTARATESEAAMAAQSTGVAIVNLKQIFDRLTEFKDGMKFIEDQKKDSQTRIDELKDKLTKMNTDITNFPKDGNMLERLKLQQQALEIEAQLEARAKTLSILLQVQAGDLMRQTFDKVVEASERLAKKDGWDIILIDDRAVKPPERLTSEDGKEGRRLTVNEVESVIKQRHILMAAKRVDVTDSLIDMMNSEAKNPPKK
jgi:Skp family chaperone for outer membrane proteins